MNDRPALPLRQSGDGCQLQRLVAGDLRPWHRPSNGGRPRKTAPTDVSRRKTLPAGAHRWKAAA